MLTKFIAAFLAMFMPMIIAINGISVSIPGVGDIAQIEYDFANDKAGSAAGTVTVESKIGGTYDLFWGNENGEKLFVEVKGKAAYYSVHAVLWCFGF